MADRADLIDMARAAGLEVVTRTAVGGRVHVRGFTATGPDGGVAALERLVEAARAQGAKQAFETCAQFCDAEAREAAKTYDIPLKEQAEALAAEFRERGND